MKGGIQPAGLGNINPKPQTSVPILGRDLSLREYRSPMGLILHVRYRSKECYSKKCEVCVCVLFFFIIYKTCRGGMKGCLLGVVFCRALWGSGLGGERFAFGSCSCCCRRLLQAQNPKPRNRKPLNPYPNPKTLNAATVNPRAPTPSTLKP